MKVLMRGFTAIVLSMRKSSLTVGRVLGILISIGFLTGPNLAGASLIRDTINGCVNNPGSGCLSTPGAFNWFTIGTSSGDTAVVTDSGVEFFGPGLNIFGFNFSADFTADTVTISYEFGFVGTLAAQTFSFTGLEWLNGTGVITGLDELPGGELPVSGLGSTASSIEIAVSHVGNTSAGVAKSTTFRILTNHVVPEPATILLMCLGLALLGIAMSRVWRGEIS